MNEAFICDAIRTPFGRYGGALSSRACRRPRRRAAARADASAIKDVDWSAVDDVDLRLREPGGRGQPQRRRACPLLLAGLPEEVPGTTVNRLCGSSMDAIGIAARAIKCGETSLMIAGGVESMCRAPFVQGKATDAFSRTAEDRGHDDRLALRQSADEVAVRRRLDAGDGGKRRAAIQGSRADQDAFALRSQQRAAPRWPRAGWREEIVPVTFAQKKGDPVVGDAGRASARDDARGAREAEGRRAAGRHGDGGQRVGRQRRRVRADPRIGRGGDVATA